MTFIRKGYRENYSRFFLAGDIGGTNIKLGLFGIKNKLLELLDSFVFKSQEFKGLHEAVNEGLKYINKNYKIKITKACFAVAGVISLKKDYVDTQNIPWNVSKADLVKNTALKDVTFLNDFESIGYGINMLSKRDIAVIKKGKQISKAPIVIIGAGTGLGRTTLIYNEHYKLYIPVPTEAGHTDFSAQNQDELTLINFIKKHRKIKQSVSYEQVLSGQGLSNIYFYLRHNKKSKETIYTKEIDKSDNKAELISEYRGMDKTCKTTFEMFKTIYARFARNCALDCLAVGGVYITGGIAPRNRDIFDKGFVKIFDEHHKLSETLKKIPIYLILSNDAGLLGAGFVGANF